jgi:hypothetical protein
MATTAPKLQPKHHTPPEHPSLVPDRLDRSHQRRETYPVDPTQGGTVGADPYDDPTQGRKIGADPYDDPTQGQKIGSDPYDDPIRGR